MVTWLPNYYPPPSAVWSGTPRPQVEPHWINVGCFGAIRPLKNHLTQAIAAMVFADNLRHRLRFHANATRIEGRGEPILHNLQALFAHSRHELVEHDWLDHDAFLDLLGGGVDVALQVSFSETFNIVSADAVACGVPVIASPAVPWLGAYAMANPDDAGSISDALMRLWQGSQQARLFAQRRDLAAYCAASEAAWGARFA
jgi:glycosyltransferase involved in cell wall biosynthesis